jgi:hypothetical protein
MTDSDKSVMMMMRYFERNRASHGEPSNWPGYWANCILNYAESLKLVWC